MAYHEYDEVLLKDGRRGTIMGGGPGSYWVDVGNSPETWDNITVTDEEIESLLERPAHSIPLPR